MSSEHPDPIDIHVGQRLKLRRTLIGMSQEQLGDLLGVTFQQIQKYERGTNRMGSSRLFVIGRILNTPVAWFFEELDDAPAPLEPAFGLSEDRAGFRYETPRPRPTSQPSPVDSREALELVRAFNRIPDASIRRRLYELTRALADLPPVASLPAGAYPDSNGGDWSLSRPNRSS